MATPLPVSKTWRGFNIGGVPFPAAALADRVGTFSSRRGTGCHRQQIKKPSRWRVFNNILRWLITGRGML